MLISTSIYPYEYINVIFLSIYLFKCMNIILLSIYLHPNLLDVANNRRGQ